MTLEVEELRTHFFTKAGVVRLFCDIHSEMSGVILVVDTPYFTRPDADGRFQLDDVPEGEYTAVVWQEVAGVDSTRVLFNSNKVKVGFDPARISADEIARTITELGYPVVAQK